MTLTDDELRHAISAGMTHILEGVVRVRHRRARIAASGSPLSIRASRAERRRDARERPSRPMRQQLLLTPLVRRLRIVVDDIQPTELDGLVSDEEAAALEEWSLCEEVLAGRTKSASWDLGLGGGGQTTQIPDAWMATLATHARKRKRLDAGSLQILSAFTALQNGSEGALSPAQCGMRFFPRARNKREAFLRAVADVARKLV